MPPSKPLSREWMTMDVEKLLPADAETHTVALFRRRAGWQAVALTLLAALPALGSWVLRPADRSPTHPPRPVLTSNASPSVSVAGPIAESLSDDNIVGLDQATAQGDKVLWIDARQRVDFERSHVPGALLLNEEEWNTRFPAVLEVWNPERQVVVYCDGGACQASRQVAARLRDAGIQGAQALRGGWPAWVKRFGEPKP